MSYRELNAVDLVKQWRKLVNDNISLGRDSHILKQALIELSPVQILLGMYSQVNNRTISIPQFLRNKNEWVEDDEFTAEVDLAICISQKCPPDYYLYLDNLESNTPQEYQACVEAKKRLMEWSQGVLG